MLDPGVDVGAALGAARQRLGLSLDEVAEATRVKSRHLAALEARAFDQLPSRPFTIGYVRAYAKALGLDADQTAQRFRAENPSPDDELHSPVGVAHERARPSRALTIVAALAIAAVVGWNIALHAVANPPAPPGSAPMRLAGAQPAGGAGLGVFQVETPLPAPPEASIPAPYRTPGLEAAAAAGGSADAADAAAKATAAQAALAPAVAGPPRPFVAQGAVYGPAAAAASGLVIQAKQPISLEIRSAAGAVYFARELAAGEAYRVPNIPGLTAEVSDPADAELFEGGLSKGVLAAPQTALKLPGQAIPGQPVPGQASPGQPIPGQPVPGQQISARPPPGQAG
ncbi:MAG TPA: helix-turn-helix transcriptional regulator [Caulobacteraceae bacterium]|nr:helix-turn-helix transcriptional regulator [Caulobacteraceae bacterium]